MKQKPYVYGLYYPESMEGTCFYIGKGKGKRIHDHEQEAKGHRPGGNAYKCNVIRKIWANGEEVVKKKLAHFETDEEALMYEIALVFFMEGLTNLTDGGEGASGYVHTEESRQRRSEVNRQRGPISEETRRRMSESGKRKVFSEAHWQNIGKAGKGKKKPPMSEAQRLLLSEMHAGMKHSEASRRKMSEARKGKPHSESHRQNLKKARNERPPISEITRQRMSQASSNRQEETLRKLSESTGKRTDLVRDSKGRYMKKEEAS